MTKPEPGPRAEPPPFVSVEAVTFSDGTTLSFTSQSVVAFVGPNNAGKTRALRDIDFHLRGSGEGQVLTEISLRRTGEASQVKEHVKAHSMVAERGARSDIARGFGYNVQVDIIQQRWSSHLMELGGFFGRLISTDTRLSDSNPPSRIAFRTDPPTHPIHLLHQDDQLEQRLSGYFARAFGVDLIVDRNAGDNIPLLVGVRPELADGEHFHHKAYDDRLTKVTTPLQHQGDGMRSFASVLLNLFATATPSILLLDEPEAFLHPPQARMLGTLLASRRRPHTQLFVATHSPEVLEGLLENTEPDNIRIVRIQRIGNCNTPHELDKAKTQVLIKNPVMRYLSVLSGIFHEQVIVCESDADCMFYSTLLRTNAVTGSIEPDVHFVHTSGKDRMHTVVDIMKAAGVPVDAIVDIDILESEKDTRRLFETLGGDWTTVEKDVRVVRSSVIHGMGVAKPWTHLKRVGVQGLPGGEASKAFTRVSAAFQHFGLWLVDVGEVENFCKQISGHGPRWVQDVLESYNPESSLELKEARDFLARLWASRKRAH